MIALLGICFLLHADIGNAQVGIGTTLPDSSSVLDLYSAEKGFLLPRITTTQRDLIHHPAEGLMIYNLETHSVQVNTGTPSSPVWIVTGGEPESSIISVSVGGDVNTMSPNDEIIPGMTLMPPAGNYLVLFNAQFGLVASEPVSTAQGVIDLLAANAVLMNIPATNTDHGPIFGNGETLLPGVYAQAAAASLAGTLTLDGGGDANALFIIRTGGALTTGAGTTVILTNGADANNIFWLSGGALSLAANTTMKGTLIAQNAAASAAADSDLEGRMFSTTGALSMGPGTASVPLGECYVDLGVLSSFVLFTVSGAVANTEPSTITGDVGTNLGAISGFDNLNGNVYGPGAAPPPINNTIVTFSVYKDAALVPYSSRTNDVNTSFVGLQAMTTVVAGEEINIQWRIDDGGVLVGNRILTLIRVD